MATKNFFACCEQFEMKVFVKCHWCFKSKELKVFVAVSIDILQGKQPEGVIFPKI